MAGDIMELVGPIKADQNDKAKLVKSSLYCNGVLFGIKILASFFIRWASRVLTRWSMHIICSLWGRHPVSQFIKYGCAFSDRCTISHGGNVNWPLD